MVYITATVGSKSIKDEYYVLVWFEIDNPLGAQGSLEAFTCKMQYVRDPSDFNIDTVSIETYDGLGMDFSSVKGANAEWYIEQS